LKQLDLLAALVKRLHDDDLVIAIFGGLSDDLYNLSDRKGNFYMRGAMGLASSLGLGLALTVAEKRIIVLDGDASILMNLGSYATIGRESPPNLVHIVVDNESHGATGGYPTATAKNADLASIAKGAGIANATTVDDEEKFIRSFEQTQFKKGPHLIVAKVDRDPSPRRANIMRLVHVKERFMTITTEKNTNLLPP